MTQRLRAYLRKKNALKLGNEFTADIDVGKVNLPLFLM